MKLAGIPARRVLAAVGAGVVVGLLRRRQVPPALRAAVLSAPREVEDPEGSTLR